MQPSSTATARLRPYQQIGLVGKLFTELMNVHMSFKLLSLLYTLDRQERGNMHEHELKEED